MIDIWLIFNLTLPFVEVYFKLLTFSSFFPQVLLQTYIEHLRGKIEDGMKTINHHGREVQVDEHGHIIDSKDNKVAAMPGFEGPNTLEEFE